MNELTIIPDPLFTVSTEGKGQAYITPSNHGLCFHVFHYCKPNFWSSKGILFQSIKGTQDGRIFLAGRDGCLHEVIYSAEKGTSSYEPNSWSLTNINLTEWIRLVWSSLSSSEFIKIKTQLPPPICCSKRFVGRRSSSSTRLRHKT